MTITAKNGTTVTINGLDFLLSILTVSIIAGGLRLKVTKTADDEIVIPETPFDQLTNGETGEKFETQAEFLEAIGEAFQVFSPSQITYASTAASGVVKKVAASANVATAPGAAYVQAEAQAVLTELRDLKAKMITAGILTA